MARFAIGLRGTNHQSAASPRYMTRQGGHRVRTGIVLVLGALLLGLLVFPIQVDASHTGNPYKIIPNHSSNYQCLDATNGNWGTVVQQSVCTGASSQSFDFVDVGGGWHNIKPKNVSGVCLDVAGGSQSDGAQLVLWGCHDGQNQQFFISQCSTGCMGTIIARHSGKCLEVKTGSIIVTTEINQTTCGGRISQQFSIHNDSTNRQKTGFAERWYHGPCGSSCSVSWMTLPFHRNVPSSLQSAWNSAITNAKAAWNVTPNSIFLSEDPSGVSYPNHDVILQVDQDGIWSIPELGVNHSVGSGVLGKTYWLNLDRSWACPSTTKTCPTNRVPDTWWWAIIVTREQTFIDSTSDVGIRALLRQATVAHETGHAFFLRHEYSPLNPEVPDGTCSASPTKPSIMDGDCILRTNAQGQLLVPTYVGPQPWDSCGINHGYYDPNWGYSGC